MSNQNQLGFNFDDPEVLETLEEKKRKEKEEKEAKETKIKAQKELETARSSLKSKLKELIEYEKKHSSAENKNDEQNVDEVNEDVSI